MDGIALACSDLPLELIEQHGLSRLMYERGGDREFRFLRQVPDAILPIRHSGQLRIVSWGSRNGKLPATGYTWLKTVEAGEWIVHRAEPVEILATAGFHNGIWFDIRRGVKGLLATAGESEAAYMIVEPSTYYYQIMTRADRMPVLIGEHI